MLAKFTFVPIKSIKATQHIGVNRVSTTDQSSRDPKQKKKENVFILVEINRGNIIVLSNSEHVSVYQTLTLIDFLQKVACIVSRL